MGCFCDEGYYGAKCDKRREISFDLQPISSPVPEFLKKKCFPTFVVSSLMIIPESIEFLSSCDEAVLTFALVNKYSLPNTAFR